MLQKTQAIILLKQNYKENEMILTTYTKFAGRISFILYGASSKKGGKRQAFLQPLSLVEIEADIRTNRDLQVIKSITNEQPLNDILSDPYKNTTALFLAEFVSKALKASMQDEIMFQYLHDSVVYLNLCDRKCVSNFHIAFLVRLSVFIGLTPNLGPANHANTYFDLKQSEYIRYAGKNSQVISPAEQNFLRQLLRINYRNMNKFHFSRNERANLLNRIIEYYQLHAQGFGNLKTLDVLHAVFDA